MISRNRLLSSPDLSTVSLICPRNDGESVAIIDIARSLSIDVRVSCQPWGATLDREPPETFRDLKANVVIVEIPGLQKEAELRLKHTVYIIDHHHYEGLDRTNPSSSLEQFADLIGHKLSRRELGIALNDRGYISALLQSGYTESETKEIREFDLKAQGYNENDFAVLEVDYSRGWLFKNAIYVVETSHERTSYLGDVHYWNNESRKDKLDLLILKVDLKGFVQDVSFSGTPRNAQILFATLGGFCGGDGQTSMYWGKDFHASTTIASLLEQLSQVLFRQASDIYEKG